MCLLPNLFKLEARGHWGIKCGLENPKALLQALGHPEKACPVVLIAGTNGKGSTGAFLAHALKACGVRAGWTTSPHLLSPCERIVLDGQSLSEVALDHHLGNVFACEDRLGIKATYFELMIASAFLAFQEGRMELALVEVGMGGRWDATNAAEPALTLLTNVALDHTQYLGDTLEAIAREKLCTARNGKPLVLGPRLSPEWIAPLLSSAPVILPALPVTHFEPLSILWDHSLVQGDPPSRRVGLGGRHQLENLTTALTAIEVLRHMGFALSPEWVWQGIARTQWPGRLWAVPGFEGVWMDGAHNPDGARRLAEHAQHCHMRPHLFFGAMKDKDLLPMASQLALLNPLSLTLLRGENERYASAEQLRTAWHTDVPILDIPAAANQLAKPCSEPRLVTGSLFLLGDMLRSMGCLPVLRF